ncbi:MAG: NAD(P)H-dependent oxidoreductase [Myxococcales bacterium]|nr:NAD(P)H-dependent oxidoreductase [Myxococcales bacterium]
MSMRIVAISGSLRAQSSNAAILRAARRAPVAGLEWTLYEAVGRLPHFNPDLDVEGATPPREVAELRAQLAAADAVLLCSPEYAHGVPGSLKNALDWLVSVGELVGKPIAVITASPTGGEHAQMQLVHTLQTMSWRVVDEACLQLSLGRAQLDARGEVADAAVIRSLHDAVAALATRAARDATPRNR